MKLLEDPAKHPAAPSAYLAEINGEAVIIIAQNILQALDAITSTGKEGHLVYQKSLPVIVYEQSKE